MSQPQQVLEIRSKMSVDEYTNVQDTKEFKIRHRIEQRKYHQKHREYYKMKNREWYQKNKNKANIHSAICRRNNLADYRRQVLKLLGNRCSNSNCSTLGGESDWRCLQIDHVNGGGRLERKSFSSERSYMKNVLFKIQNSSKDYKLLCANCNWKKKYDKESKPRSVFL
jgi:hypothetical protein